jgi:molybdopterin-containing oxidoreductase family membrane subunit
MKLAVEYRELALSPLAYYGLLAVLALVVMLGLGAAYYMEHEGHIVTGMGNQVVWGMPHIFAIFLIVAASGALNVASISSVFGNTLYKPLARLSGLLAIALLVGGLAVLVLDLGRPERLIIAMTYYNFKSIFAWNIYLYTGFMGIVAVYLWMMMEERMNRYAKAVGTFAFIWRFLLTTGTGSIFGFLVAREAYDTAVLAPMFIVLSLALGLAAYLLVLMGLFAYARLPLGDALLQRMRSLLGIFVATVLYFSLAYHLTNLYITERHGIEAFILRDGGIYPWLFWLGHIGIGSLLPLALVYHPTFVNCRPSLIAAALSVLAGGFALLYVIIIGGQVYPLELFPGMVVSSTFQDGIVVTYVPSLPEILLGVGGIGIALLAVVVAAKVLRFLPTDLSDATLQRQGLLTTVEPH